MSTNTDYKNQQFYIDKTRSFNPGKYRDWNDEEVYEDYKRMSIRNGYDVPDYLPPVYQSPTTRIDTETKDVTSPTYIGTLYGYAEKLGLSGLAELGTETGLQLDLPGQRFDVDISADAFKKAYNESNVGHLYEAIHGKKKMVNG